MKRVFLGLVLMIGATGSGVFAQEPTRGQRPRQRLRKRPRYDRTA